jgi:hypothetical protein
MQNDVEMLYKVPLTITCYNEITPDSEIEMYGSAVKYLTYWMAKQDGAGGLDTPALFEELKRNVCLAMAVGCKGSA